MMTKGALRPTPGIALHSASRFTSVGPALLSFRRSAEEWKPTVRNVTRKYC